MLRAILAAIRPEAGAVCLEDLAARLDVSPGALEGMLQTLVQRGYHAPMAIGSLAVAVTVGYDVVGGARARRSLDALKAWLALHNAAVLAVLYLVFGAVLIAQALDPRS